MAVFEEIGMSVLYAGVVIFILVAVIFVVAIASIKASQNTGPDSDDHDGPDKPPDKQGSCSSNAHT